jgi:hypothetical protein
MRSRYSPVRSWYGSPGCRSRSGEGVALGEVLVSVRRGVGLVVSLSRPANLREYLFYECAVRHSIGLIHELVDYVFHVVLVVVFVVVFGDVERGQLVLSLCSCAVASFDLTVFVLDDGVSEASRIVVFDVPRHDYESGKRVETVSVPEETMP